MSRLKKASTLPRPYVSGTHDLFGSIVPDILKPALGVMRFHFECVRFRFPFCVHLFRNNLSEQKQFIRAPGPHLDLMDEVPIAVPPGGAGLLACLLCCGCVFWSLWIGCKYLSNSGLSYVRSVPCLRMFCGRYYLVCHCCKPELRSFKFNRMRIFCFRIRDKYLALLLHGSNYNSNLEFFGGNHSKRICGVQTSLQCSWTNIRGLQFRNGNLGGFVVDKSDQ
jgi:hypothetical protein